MEFAKQRQAMRWALLASVLLAATSCSAHLAVHDVTDLKDGETAEGVPFRAAERYRATLYRRTSDPGATPAYEALEAWSTTAQSRKRVYAVNVRTGLLANSTTKVILNPNSTLKEVDLDASSNADEVLTKVAEQTTAIKNALATEEAAREAEREAAADDLAAQQALERAALEAMQEVEAAEFALKIAEKTGKATEIIRAKQRLILARFDANLAYRNLDRPEPFPG